MNIFNIIIKVKAYPFSDVLGFSTIILDMIYMIKLATIKQIGINIESDKSWNLRTKIAKLGINVASE